MAKDSRNSPHVASETKAKKDRKPVGQVKAEIVDRARKVVRRAVVRLQSMEVRTSGNPEGNWELIKSYKAFDEQLQKLTNGANGNATSAEG